MSQFVTQKKTQDKLVKELLPRLKGRTSGYTSMVKLGRRLGDDTPMVQMSLILEASENLKISKASLRVGKSEKTVSTETKSIGEKPKKQSRIKKEIK